MNSPQPINLDDDEQARLRAVFEALSSDLMRARTSLRTSAEQAVSDDQPRYAEALTLAARICSLSLVPGNASHPFRAMWESPNGRSFALDDLSANDLLLVREMAGIAPTGLLGARLNDISWHCLRPRNPDHAVAAIDLYRSIPLEETAWVAGGREAWYRAIGLARMIKGRAGNALQEIQSSILNAFLGTSSDNGYLAIWLADTLNEHKLQGIDAQSIADHLASLGTSFSSHSDFGRAADYFEAAASWYKAGGDEQRETETIIAIADQKCAEAGQRASGEQASNMAASSFIEEAIHTLRRIPSARRSAFAIEQRIEQLGQELAQFRHAATGEMHAISSGPTDVSELVRRAREAVSGKSLQEAIKSLVMLGGIARVSDLQQSARDQLRASPLMAFIGGRIIGRDGRVVAVRPSYNSSEPDSESSQTALFAQMVQSHLFMIGLRVQARILPALEVITAEHAVTMQMLYRLCAQSPVVPPDRADLIARGLHYGFEGDWVAAVHVLVPQLENLVRIQLKLAGAITTVMDSTGVTNEVGLSTLMSFAEVETALGPDMAFEIRALFCSHFGPNLRNEIAHGLLSDGDLQAAGSVYTWWFILFLVKHAWLSRNQESADAAQEFQSPHS
jgi:hypothetical protein